MLASDLGEGARVLDLYSGSGALAFEALSRGAEQAVVVEQGRDAIAAIRENARALGVEDRVEIVASRVEKAVSSISGPFDLVFLDPPYIEVPRPAFASVLDAAARLLAPGGVLVLEHASGDVPPRIPRLAEDRSRRYGDTSVTLFRLSAD